MAGLHGKVALVTGGGRGIGRAIALKLAANGANVAISFARNPGRAADLVAEARSMGVDAEAIEADAADAAAVKALVAAVVERFGRLDILVNNAGVFEMKTLRECGDDDFEQMIAVNVRAVFVASREASRAMGEGGRIIIIGSVNGDRVPFAGGALYGMSKAAVRALARGWARDLGPSGITVNCVQPGPIDTEMNPAVGDFAEVLSEFTALNRYGDVDEVANLVAFLASPEASYITGASLDVDGGFNA